MIPLENVLKASWRRMTKANILPKTSWRRLTVVFWRLMTKANIFLLIKTSWTHLLKTKTKDVFETSSSRRMFAAMVLYIRQMQVIFIGFLFIYSFHMPFNIAIVRKGLDSINIATWGVALVTMGRLLEGRAYFDITMKGAALIRWPGVCNVLLLFISVWWRRYISSKRI